MAFTRPSVEFRFQKFNFSDHKNYYNQNSSEILNYSEFLKKQINRFFMIEQNFKNVQFFNLNMNYLCRTFDVPICIGIETMAPCSRRCVCESVNSIGYNLYKRGCVHNFHQIGNYLIGSIIEQQTDPFTRVAIRLDEYISFIRVYLFSSFSFIMSHFFQAQCQIL
jgi:hypothetical protein